MGGAFIAPFVHVDRGGVCRMSTLVHSRGGVKIGSKLVHVVVECPPKLSKKGGNFVSMFIRHIKNK